MSVIQHLEVDRGNDHLLTDTIAGKNITGWQLQFVLKRRFEDLAALVTKTVGGGITITDGPNGVFTVALAKADTNRTPGLYVYSIARVDTGSQTTLTKGFITILPAAET